LNPVILLVRRGDERQAQEVEKAVELQWAWAHGYWWNATTCARAAQGGHLEVLKWARLHGCPWHTELMCRAAAAGGHLAVLQWVREQGCLWGGSAACSAAARGGHLEVLKWARANGCPLGKDWVRNDTCREALAGGCASRACIRGS